MRIETNYEYNLIELYFDEKPNEMTRETLKMFKWRWNPKKFCWYNKKNVENIALAESLNKKIEEMKNKQIPNSYSKKYINEVSNTIGEVKKTADSSYTEKVEQDKNILKVSESNKKNTSKSWGKIIDIDDDNFELDL